MVAVESVVPMVSLTPEKELIAEERLLRLQASMENLPATQRKKTGNNPSFRLRFFMYFDHSCTNVET